ncbi:nuclear transport factor 2 family protein [Mycolicibacterium cosmeticum]|uniref:nuclear transport factor 2 family protein n=1 Tax=Mycolicibacterium cosmeticum TaxID=258533 RepID=UPI0032048495
MLSIEEISDRLEIQDLLIAYSTAIDTRRFDDLDRVFTPDAYIDYRAMGGVDGHFPEVKAWLAQVLPNFPAYAHMLGNVDIRLAGDSATSRTLCFNPMVLGAAPAATSGAGAPPDSGGEQPQVLFCGLWYEDEFVRTADGWRMSRRVEVKCFDRVV